MLRARKYILYENAEYFPGDILPTDSPLAETWIENGVAFETDAEEPVRNIAKRVTAPVGETGEATPKTADEDLAGQVPPRKYRADTTTPKGRKKKTG